MIGKTALSVLVLTYNQADYIDQTIKSILTQNHTFDYEIVVGDDCSTDATVDILKKLQKENPEIIRLILNAVNTGLVANYHNTLKHCNGEIIMQCGGDDYWIAGKVQLQMDFLNNNPDCGMCYTRALHYYQDKKLLSKHSIGWPIRSFDELLQSNPVTALTVAFRKKLLNFYFEDLGEKALQWRLEDYPFWLWMYLHSSISFLDSTTGVYRVLAVSYSHNTDLDKALLYADSISSVRKYFSKYSKNKKVANLSICDSYKVLVVKGLIAGNKLYVRSACNKLAGAGLMFSIIGICTNNSMAFLMTRSALRIYLEIKDTLLKLGRVVE